MARSLLLRVAKKSVGRWSRSPSTETIPPSLSLEQAHISHSHWEHSGAVCMVSEDITTSDTIAAWHMTQVTNLQYSNPKCWLKQSRFQLPYLGYTTICGTSLRIFYNRHSITRHHHSNPIHLHQSEKSRIPPVARQCPSKIPISNDCSQVLSLYPLCNMSACP